MARGKHDVTAPRKMKAIISKFAPQFDGMPVSIQTPTEPGYAQHDSQEFLSFLLDALHEDLNRGYRRQTSQEENADREDSPVEGESEEIKSQRSWDLHKKNNDSIVVDLFQGSFFHEPPKLFT